MELKNGTLLQGGKYRIEQTLGQGSFGITYLAMAKFSTNGNLGKMDVLAKVAIKEFFMSDINGRKEDGSTVEGSTGSIFTNYKKRFRKEAENLAKLSHHNIVKVFDVFDENNTTYYVMEYLGDTSLNKYIKDKKSLPEEECIELSLGIGDALQYMHNAMMLHLDLKPGNIMLYKGEPILIDFGLSKQFNANGQPETSTTIGQGTPGYAPLEQQNYNGNQVSGLPYAMDVYALGGTMFKMITGETPPDASSIFNDGFPKDELTSHKISPQLIDIIEKAMAPSKKERYNSITELLSAFMPNKKRGIQKSKSNSGTSVTKSNKADDLTDIHTSNPFAASVSEEESNKESKISYNWALAIISFAIGFIWILIMQNYVHLSKYDFNDLDTDGWMLAYSFGVCSLAYIYYLLAKAKQITNKRWNMYKVIAISLFSANTLLLTIWNYSLTMAYVVLSVGLLVIVFILLLINKHSD